MSYLVNPYMVSPSGGMDDTNLRCYWKFDEVSGDIINQSVSGDSLGSGANLQNSGGTYNQTGSPSNFGNNMLLDGTNDFLTSGSSMSQYNFLHNNTTDWTINAWYKMGSTFSDGRAFFDTHGYSATQNQIGFQTLTNGGYSSAGITMSIGNGAGLPYPQSFAFANSNGSPMIPNTTAYNMFTWNFLTASQNIEMFSNASAFSTLTPTGYAFTTSDASYSLKLSREAGRSSNFMPCNLLEISIWSRTLTQDELDFLYNSGDGNVIY